MPDRFHFGKKNKPLKYVLGKPVYQKNIPEFSMRCDNGLTFCASCRSYFKIGESDYLIHTFKSCKEHKKYKASGKYSFSFSANMFPSNEHDAPKFTNKLKDNQLSERSYL